MKHIIIRMHTSTGSTHGVMLPYRKRKRKIFPGDWAVPHKRFFLLGFDSQALYTDVKIILKEITDCLDYEVAIVNFTIIRD